MCIRDRVYESWKSDPEGFWRDAAKLVDWTREPNRIFDPSAGIYGRWFPDAECNTCHNAVDRHVERGRADQLALVHDSAITGTVRKFTYAELKAEIVALAAVLSDNGIGKGDVVIIYMPMVAEAAIAMLACARLGAVHSVVFGGFAARELATRIDDAKPKAIITASCGLEPGRTIAYQPLYDGAISIAKHKVETVIVLQREQQTAALTRGRDIDYAAATARAKSDARDVPCVPVEATDPLYILYTSGTTGQPKGVVRDNGGHLVVLAWSMENEFGIQPGEAFWAASDVGWVVGHSYIVYAPLIHGCTTILFEGKPVGTLPVKYGSPGVPMPGWQMEILDDSGHPVPRGTLGNVVAKLPLPPGSLPTLWHADERFKSAYLAEFPGYYKTADAGIIDEDGYLFIMARTDDIINVAGHRLSTGAMEEVLSEHPDVAECAVIGMADPMKGQIPCGFVVLNAGVDRPAADIEREIVALVRNRIGAIAALKTVVPVKRLPKTRSGKILRATMQKIADREDWTMPATIDDPAILEEVEVALRGRGIG